MINTTSELAQAFWEKGKLDDCPILDFHAHMHDCGGLFLPHREPEGMLETMDACNTLLTCFAGHEALEHPGTGVSKDLAAAQKYPDRFRVYHAVVSRWLNPEADLKRMEEQADLFVGFKYHPSWYGVPLSDPRHDPYWEYANAKRLLVLSHTWGGSPDCGPEEVAKVLERYPEVVFIAGHSFHGDWNKAPEFVTRFPNFYIELTAVLDNRGHLDRWVQQVGSERILFGTDLPWFATHHGIGAVLSAEMTDEDRRNILYRNGAKLLSRFPWFAKIWGDRAA